MKRMDRRRFIHNTVALGVAASLGQNITAQSQRRKPNLLVIWTDEQRADTMAAYGNTKIHAPNLNKLARESIVFENAYVSQPVCTPSRSTVMTGLWPHTSGCTMNNIPLKKETPCFPELINDPEYRTAYMGKWHLGDEIFAQHGFAEWVSIEDGYSGYYGKDRDRKLRSDYHHFLLEKGYQPDGGGRFSRSFATRRPIEHCKPKFLEIKACEFLRRHRNKPFMLYVNFLEPHMPFFGPLDNEHDPKEVTLPSNFHDPLEANEPLRYRVKREACIDNYGPGDNEYRQLIGKYWGLVTQVDRSVGAILQTLESLGLADNTIVVYTSDHGDMMGAHQLVEKSVMYEEAVKVPWLTRIPWLTKKQKIMNGRYSHIDLVPTLIELMVKSEPNNFPGQSLVSQIQSGRSTPRDVFIQWNPKSGALKTRRGGTKLASKEELKRVENESTRTVITPEGWKLCLSDVEKCQLFNLNDDPGETTNLFDSGKHKDVIRQLTKKIRQWQDSVQDTIPVGL
jgi:arylsulfatase A-like enzyme